MAAKPPKLQPLFQRTQFRLSAQKLPRGQRGRRCRSQKSALVVRLVFAFVTQLRQKSRCSLPPLLPQTLALQLLRLHLMVQELLWMLALALARHLVPLLRPGLQRPPAPAPLV